MGLGFGGQKRNISELDDESEDEEPPDEVRLYEDGFKDRYYESKFEVDSSDQDFRILVANEYAVGLCWVLRYVSLLYLYFISAYSPECYFNSFLKICKQNIDFQLYFYVYMFLSSKQIDLLIGRT